MLGRFRSFIFGPIRPSSKGTVKFVVLRYVQTAPQERTLRPFWTGDNPHEFADRDSFYFWALSPNGGKEEYYFRIDDPRLPDGRIRIKFHQDPYYPPKPVDVGLLSSWERVFRRGVTLEEWRYIAA